MGNGTFWKRQIPYQLDQLCPLSEPYFLDWFPTFARVLSEPRFLDWFPTFARVLSEPHFLDWFPKCTLLLLP